MAKRSVPKKESSKNREDDYVFPIEKFKISDDVLEEAELLISYFRQFPYALCEQYLNVKLYDYQKIILYEMMHKYNFIWIACRNLAKTFLSALYICCRCILYPKTKVIVCAPERQQAVETITKIKDLMKNSPMLREEISDISDSMAGARCLFWNGSTVRIATMSEGSRHYRANLILCDEFIGSDPDILSSVIEAFMGDPRRPAYLDTDEYRKSEYAYLREKDTSMYTSSAGYAGTWAHQMFTDYFEKMVKGEEDYFVCDLPYQTAVACGLRDLNFYTKQRLSPLMTPEKFSCEYEGIWINDNENGFYKYTALDNCRTLQKAVYPQELMSFIESKNKKFIEKKKQDGVIRICGADISTVGSRINDASAFGVLQLVPKERTVRGSDDSVITIPYYDRELIYIETKEGMLVKDQANRLKQLFYEFDCDYMVVDAMNAGVTIIQILGEPSVNPENGENYPPLMCCNKDEYAEMCNYPNAKKVLYALNAGAQSNHDMAQSLQACIGQRSLKLLINENTAKDYLRVLQGYDDFPFDTRMDLELPYLNTALLINEMVALEKKPTDNGLIKLKEPSSGRKDRYSCLLYMNGIADELQLKLKQPKKKKKSFNVSFTPQDYFNN